MADGVLVTDHEGRVVLHNPALVRMLKMEISPPLGHALDDGLENDCWRGFVRRIRETTEGSTVSQEVVVGDLTLMAHIAPVRSEEGETLGSVTVLRDISMLKAIDRMKSDFV